jgi:hypothetical protein
MSVLYKESDLLNQRESSLPKDQLCCNEASSLLPGLSCVGISSLAPAVQEDVPNTAP